MAADRAPIVFHNRTLDRLTTEDDAVRPRHCAIPLRDSEDRILSLYGLLGIVDGRVPLVIEVQEHLER